MPGLYRSPGLADIDVCFGKRQAGTEALRRTSQRQQQEIETVEELMQRPRRSVTLPLPGAHHDEDEEEDIWVQEAQRPSTEIQERDASDGPSHEDFGDRRVEETGLPPTPPAASNSEGHQAEPQPLFADGVRNALSSQKSGALSTTPVNPQLSPPTPDTTPPAHPANADLANRRQVSPEMPEAPPMPSVLNEVQNLPASRPQLETFQTAHEDLPICEAEDDGRVYLPEDDRLPDHWLDDTQNMPDLSGGVDDKVAETGDFAASGTAAEEVTRTVSPAPSRTRYRFESPSIERQESDWEKHISYVSGPDELDLGAADDLPAEVQEDAAERVAGLGVSGMEPEQRHPSAEDMNNAVYKQIQQDNIRRERAFSANSAAIRAGIVLPSLESTPKSIKRKAKCTSLRDETLSETNRNSGDSPEHMLKHERRHLPLRRTLQDSPVLTRKRGLEGLSPRSPSDLRQVSSPARMVSDASQAATRTLASKLASNEHPLGPNTAHRLKRQSHGERLSKNMQVRRTSQEVSPEDLEAAFNRIDRGAASVRRLQTPTPQGKRMDMMQAPSVQASRPGHQPQMNRGVKRSKVPSADAYGELRPRNAIHPFVSEPESPSSPRQVRRFSREDRLENNEEIRRRNTVPQPNTLDRVPSTRQPVTLEKQQISNQPDESPHQLSSESAPRRTSGDPSVLSSPRKSLDAHFLHPTATPMSVSGFSDRTADIEVCEASGVRIYPHNNESLLVVQQASGPVSKDKTIPDGPAPADVTPNTKPTFTANIDPPTPILGSSNPEAHVDSPLTNPRAAPEPPRIHFIPPTPHEELDRELGHDFRRAGISSSKAKLPGRTVSFKQKVRRYSDSFFGRTTAPKRQLTELDTHLSPMWRSQDFWENYDSDHERYIDYEPGSNILPTGGDTSHVVDRRRLPLLPRAMSSGLPGFRGKGGFLSGESVGIDRHGTTNRRHYVSERTRPLTKQKSDELLANLSFAPTPPLPREQPRSRPKSRSRSRSSGRVPSPPRSSKGFKVPFTSGRRAQWVGTEGIREKMLEIRFAQKEREQEKRREALKGKIGIRVYHG